VRSSTSRTTNGYYVLGAPYTVFFLPFIGLVTLSMYSAIAVVVGIDGAAVRERLSGVVPVRLVGGFLAVDRAAVHSTLDRAEPVGDGAALRSIRSSAS
jgi:hypothetical protein